MEEEIGSMVSNGETLAIEELSDSSSRTRPFPARKRAKLGHNICNSKFKGVVPQANGKWGCQVYANHQRIWLGTFKSEKEAAMAYDSAAIKLRSVDSRRNFPTTAMTVEEPKFQNYYSAEAILNMIKDGTYQSKFTDFVRTCSKSVDTELSLKDTKAESNRGLASKQLFRKELTPSDVGKLNRLVIPKKYALKFFPPISENDEENVAAGKVDVQLIFYDRSMKLWKFRYCYWKSSQSYVFTRGWNRFVKEKQLRANDTIVFFSCEFGENAESAQTFHMIDVRKVNSSSLANRTILAEVDLQLQLGQGIASDSVKNNFTEEGRMGAKLTQPEEKKGLKLFGRQII